MRNQQELEIWLKVWHAVCLLNKGELGKAKHIHTNETEEKQECYNISHRKIKLVRKKSPPYHLSHHKFHRLYCSDHGPLWWEISISRDYGISINRKHYFLQTLMFSLRMIICLQVLQPFSTIPFTWILIQNYIQYNINNLSISRNLHITL